MSLASRLVVASLDGGIVRIADSPVGEILGQRHLILVYSAAIKMQNTSRVVFFLHLAYHSSVLINSF